MYRYFNIDRRNIYGNVESDRKYWKIHRVQTSITSLHGLTLTDWLKNVCISFLYI